MCPWPVFAAFPPHRMDEPTRIMGREMKWSSRAGAKAEEPVAVADWILCWEQPGKTSWNPRAWLPMHTKGGDRSLERDGAVSSRLFCPVRWSQAGDDKYCAMGSLCLL